MAEYTKAKKIPKVKKQQIIDIIKQFAKTILRIVLYHHLSQIYWLYKLSFLIH